MAEVKLHVLKPSVNNLAARVFVHAANLEFSEDDAWGKARSPEFLAYSSNQVAATHPFPENVAPL